MSPLGSLILVEELPMLSSNVSQAGARVALNASRVQRHQAVNARQEVQRALHARSGPLRQAVNVRRVKQQQEDNASQEVQRLLGARLAVRQRDKVSLSIPP